MSWTVSVHVAAAPKIQKNKNASEANCSMTTVSSAVRYRPTEHPGEECAVFGMERGGSPFSDYSSNDTLARQEYFPRGRLACPLDGVHKSIARLSILATTRDIRPIGAAEWSDFPQVWSLREGSAGGGLSNVSDCVLQRAGCTWGTF